MQAPGKTKSPSVIVWAATLALFMIWGLDQRVYGAIAPQFDDFFRLPPLQGTLMSASFSIAAVVLAVPSVLFLRRFGYKLGVVFGLCVLAGGALMFYPAIASHDDAIFVLAVVGLGAGWALLETSANPLVVELGSPDTAVRRLNFAQSFYPIGALAGLILGYRLVHSNHLLPIAQLAQAVVRPYVVVGLGILMLAFLIEHIEFPAVATERTGKDRRARDDFRVLLSNRRFRTGALALGSYICAQTAVWGLVFGDVRHAMVGTTEMPSLAVFWSFVLFGIGRFAATALMGRFDVMRLMLISAAASTLLTAAAAVLGGTVGMACLVATSLFMSMMYATIFAKSIAGVGPLAKTASGVLVASAGIGATLAPLAMSSVVAALGAQPAALLPCLFFGALLACVKSGCARYIEPAIGEELAALIEPGTPERGPAAE